VVNNAGIGLLGGAEESSIGQAQRLFDVNVFGVARVVNAVLPVMRAQKSGRIVNMSSILGLIPSPFNAFYASTKHAIEGYSADSNEGGQLFQSDRGHQSNLMAASLVSSRGPDLVMS
jgi:short-subunit dehydrogenase